MATKRISSTKRPRKKAVPASQMTVRMFCQGLGDCFLITIPQKDTRPYSILIDCGVAMGTPGADEIMEVVVHKIAELTEGTVDLLVVTHQHWDHVSGFIQVEAALRKIAFKHLWLAWTERADDPLASELRGKYSEAKATLAAGLRYGVQLAGINSENAQRLQGLDGILAFQGPAAAGKKGINDAIEIARSLIEASPSEENISYLLPGSCQKLPGAAKGTVGDIQAFVLGPPHDANKLTKINPSKKHPETYEKAELSASKLVLDWAWMAGARNVASASPGKDPTFEKSLPFDSTLGVSLDTAKSWAFFNDRYFDPGLGDENTGRRIDGDWLWSGVERLALRMDSYTNNTSLVLAFELPLSKKVLLFAGDAQVGNWLSWHDQNYISTDGRSLSAKDLLGGTVLYKVGHHGSHNATLREQGLELMTNPRLVAMLPVESAAAERLRYGEMPLKSLVTALCQRCDGRVLRLDEGWDSGTPPGSWNHGQVRATLSTETIEVSVNSKPSVRPLYMEYTIVDSPD